MALQRSNHPATIADRAKDTFADLAQKRAEGKIKRTVTVSFRLTSQEKKRCEELLIKNGFTMASGAKKAFYDLIKQLEKD